jgi:hypothetical protein
MKKKMDRYKKHAREGRLLPPPLQKTMKDEFSERITQAAKAFPFGIPLDFQRQSGNYTQKDSAQTETDTSSTYQQGYVNDAKERLKICVKKFTDDLERNGFELELLAVTTKNPEDNSRLDALSAWSPRNKQHFSKGCDNCISAAYKLLETLVKQIHD